MVLKPNQLIAYLKFLISATNQHGVHSPFVYGFVTKCLYNKKRFSKNKSKNILIKSIAYFKAKNIHIDANDSDLKKEISNTFATISFDKKAPDAIYIDKLKKNTLNTIIQNKNYHNDSFLFINNIKNNISLWTTLIQQKEITVSINLFYFGIVFFRREQEKEHFKIRL